MTIDELRSAAAVVRDATEEGENTATRIGQLFLDMVNTLCDVKTNAIKGYVVISNTSDLPTSPTTEQQMKGYLLGTTLYVWVGTGGDTLDGKYQSAQLKGADGAPGAPGPQGESGVDLGEVAIADNLTTNDATKVLSAKQGYVLKGLIDNIGIPVVNDLTTGGTTSALSAEMGKVLGDNLRIEEEAWTQTIKYSSMPARAAEPIMLANETYKILIQADKPMGQTAWQLWIYTANGQASIQNFGSTDMSVQQTVTYTPTEDIYSIGCRYSQGVQDTSVMMTYKIPLGTYRSLVDEFENVLEYGMTTVLDVVDNPNQKYSQRRPFMLAGRRYKITVHAEKVLTASQNWQLGGADYTSSQASKVFIHTFTNCDMSNGVSVDYTPAADIYTFYRWSQSGIDSNFTADYKVEEYNESQRLHDIESDIQSLGDIITGSGVSRFDAYYRLGGGMIDTYNLITRKIGLIVMGQSNAQGRIPNADFPATATIDTTDDLTLYKQIEHCQFMKGQIESAYTEMNMNFASRNNDGLWAFDDIVYNAVNQALGGNTDFYVLKQARGATGIRFANGSFNANVNDFAKAGYGNSQLYHLKLLFERAMSLQPTIDFKAILWHQGEAEYQVTEAGVYYECLCQIIYWLRGLVGNPKLPFIFGTVPTDSLQYSAIVKADMERVAAEINDCYLIDLGAAGDMIDDYHFGPSTAERLAREMYKIMRQNSMLKPMITPV